MAKNIILLSDGTGNSAAKLHKTNVWRTYKAIDYSTGHIEQIACYDDGVGTSSFKPMRLLGGMFGFGLRRNVIDLYVFLSQNYQNEDKIFCFGFSRGAFTIRVLVGLIASQGLASGSNSFDLRKDAEEKFNNYRHYWKKNTSTRPDDEVPIQFVGVWDTVDAYGAPVDEIKDVLNKAFHLYFPNRKLSHTVTKACHALALDDERSTFHPLLWDENGEHNSRIEQVWFSGMHSNVGGGYPDDDLAYVPLVWMLKKARSHGLYLDSQVLDNYEKRASCHGKLYDSRSGLGSFYRYAPRDIGKINRTKVQIDKTQIYPSVIERIERNYTSYSPIAMPSKFEVYGEVHQSEIGNKVEPNSNQHRNEIKKYIKNKQCLYFANVGLIALLLVCALTFIDKWSLNLLSVFLGAIWEMLKQSPVLVIAPIIAMFFVSKKNNKLTEKISKTADNILSHYRS